MIFTSIHRCETDKQGRVTLPKPFRTGSLLRGGTLFIRPTAEYLIACLEDHLLETIRSITQGDPEAEEVREVRRLWMAQVTMVHVDPQGRMNMNTFFPKEQNPMYILVGTGQDFEIWQEDVWESRYPEMRGQV